MFVKEKWVVWGRFASCAEERLRLLRLIRKPSQLVSDLVAHFAKDSEPRVLIAFCLGWIFEAPVNAVRVHGKDGTLLVGVIADGDHVIKLLSDELVYRLRAMLRDVDPELAHYDDRFRSDAS